MSKSSLDADEKPPTATTETSTVKMEAPPEYPSNQKRILVMVALYLAIFLVTLVWKIDRMEASQHTHSCLALIARFNPIANLAVLPRTKTFYRPLSLASRTSSIH